MIANALSQNGQLQLKHFEAGRDRLENKGITALGQVFASMGSLEVVHVPQNGIKDEGMSSLLGSLKSCKKLRTLRINDNWLKSQSIDNLIRVIFNCSSLEDLNISDLNMGQENVQAVMKAISLSKINQLKTFYCNYNEVTSSIIARTILKQFKEQQADQVDGGQFKLVEFIGCSGI